jgi:hypothetical protein
MFLEKIPITKTQSIHQQPSQSSARSLTFLGCVFKNIPRIVSHGKFSQHFLVFLAKRFAVMMLFLIDDIFYNGINLRMRIREGAKPFLPVKFSARPNLLIDEIAGIPLDVPNEIGERPIRLHPYKDVYMVGHCIDGDELVPLVLNDSCDILV